MADLDIWLDEDLALDLVVEMETTPSADPCRECHERYECGADCNDKIEFDMEQVEVDWDNKPSRAPEVY